MQINRTDNCHHFCMHAPFVAAALTSGARKGTKKRQIKRSREPLRDRSGTDLEPLWDACGSGRLLTQGNCDRFKILDTTLFVFVFAVNCQVGRCGRHGNKQETAAFDALPSSTERNARLFFVFCLLSSFFLFGLIIDWLTCLGIIWLVKEKEDGDGRKKDSSNLLLTCGRAGYLFFFFVVFSIDIEIYI